MAIFERLQEFPFVSPLYLLTLFHKRNKKKKKVMEEEAEQETNYEGSDIKQQHRISFACKFEKNG